MIVELPAHPEYRPPDSFAGPDHPMRKLTRAMAFGEPWTTDDADRVAAVFDGLASQWSENHVDPTKAATVLLSPEWPRQHRPWRAIQRPL